MKRIAVFASGSGTNLQTLLGWFPHKDSRATITLVISNKKEAFALERAKQAGVEAVYIPWKKNGREEFERQAQELMLERQIDLVVLAGFMRISSDAFVEHWRGRIINIHPSLLPDFPGLHPQQQALDAGVSRSGCTVHFVDNVLDGGDPILQKAVPVLSEDTAETLAARIQPAEHEAYPQAVRLWLSGLAFPVPNLSEGEAEFGPAFGQVLDTWKAQNWSVAQKQHAVRVARILRDWEKPEQVLDALLLKSSPEIALARSADELRLGFLGLEPLEERRAKWDSRDRLLERAAALNLREAFEETLSETAQEWDRTTF
ncbi:phosphoribosylglycinamide formyltransferase [Deinococcus cellulosilyticus]|uniref:Phosphoribosylglycinamide formyltransferase n=1 Tax=Deinococcus cellulosilyticus (strain DSM 18568 / NBRC 106333 / KACC 11606 / 5516J-15) TaxID=1223518 RepID=A0A511N0R5_DEIC1|nr:phosphoribosylglycinamide formyltransferase [Deinococcus cellulosilyticus]GEM46047.1 phosphoribosylglycinamide formyltransferase [Deinococcus cellulosilyticus NBRC 106333 = KACC 11606]